MPLLLERELPVSALARSQSGGVVLVVKNPFASAGAIRAAGSKLGLGRAPGGGPGNPLQYSYVENPVDREAWWAIAHRVAKSQTQLK